MQPSHPLRRDSLISRCFAICTSTNQSNLNPELIGSTCWDCRITFLKRWCTSPYVEGSRPPLCFGLEGSIPGHTTSLTLIQRRNNVVCPLGSEADPEIDRRRIYICKNYTLQRSPGACSPFKF